MPFNYQSFVDSQKLIWEFSSRKFIKSHVFYTALGLIVLTIGLLSENKEHYTVCTVFGSGYLFYIVASWAGFFERRERFYKRFKNYVSNYVNDGGKACTIIFSDHGFQYEDKEKLYKLSWFLFKPTITYKDNIILILKDTTTVSFILNKKELGDDPYQEVYAILKKKLG